MARTSSGSSRSERDVNPTRSAKRTETTLRSSRTGACASGAPQFPQNRNPSGFSCPQRWQTTMPEGYGVEGCATTTVKRPRRVSGSGRSADSARLSTRAGRQEAGQGRTRAARAVQETAGEPPLLLDVERPGREPEILPPGMRPEVEDRRLGDIEREQRGQRDGKSGKSRLPDPPEARASEERQDDPGGGCVAECSPDVGVLALHDRHQDAERDPGEQQRSDLPHGRGYQRAAARPVCGKSAYSVDGTTEYRAVTKSSFRAVSSSRSSWRRGKSGAPAPSVTGAT